MLGRMSSGKFALLCALVAILAAFIAFLFLAALLVTVEKSFRFHVPDRWEPWPGILLVALACSGGALAVAAMRRARRRAKQIAASLGTLAPAPEQFHVEDCTLDPTEAALVSLFPIVAAAYGALPANIVASVFNMAGASISATPGDFAVALLSAALGLAVLVFYADSFSRLSARRSEGMSIVFWIIAGFLILGGLPSIFVFGSIFAALAFGAVDFVAITLARSWRFLSKMDDRARFLIKPAYARIFSLRAFETFSGIPPIYRFVTERRLYVYAMTIMAAVLTTASLVSWAFLAGFYLRPGQPGDVFDRAYYVTPKAALLRVPRGFGIDAFVFIVALAAAPGMIAGAHALLRKAQSQVRFSIDQLSERDPRPPILFLRAFRDDQVGLPNPRQALLGRLFSFGFQLQSLDHLLLDEGTIYGSVVALGNPQDRFPPYGAARGYFEHKDWQQAVFDLCTKSRAIILCLDETDSIWWEVSHVHGNNHLDKTLFVLPPKFRDKQENNAVASKLIDHLSINDDAARNEIRSSFERGNTIGVFLSQDGSWKIAKSSTFSRYAYLAVLRLFLRTKLGLAN
jgi:NAD(P)-dependent dehydrogenase (short-subunit alcohol dehydrogenase family)